LSRRPEEVGYDRAVLAKAIAAGLAGLALVPSGAQVPPPSQPGPWKQIGKAATSRLAGRLHLSRTAIEVKALAFVVTSRSPRPIHVHWASYCEEQSDDGYTEDYSGRLSGVGRVTSYPHVFDGATLCYVVVNTDAIKGARVSAAVFSY
jgi:hypothetical protein